MCLILWDHTPTESTYSQMWNWVQLHSLILSERKHEGKGNPRVTWRANNNQYSPENSLVPYFQTDKGTLSQYSFHYERKWSNFFGTEISQISVGGGAYVYVCVCICMCLNMCVKRLQTLLPGLYHNEWDQGRNWGFRMEEGIWDGWR